MALDQASYDQVIKQLQSTKMAAEPGSTLFIATERQIQSVAADRAAALADTTPTGQSFAEVASAEKIKNAGITGDTTSVQQGTGPLGLTAGESVVPTGGSSGAKLLAGAIPKVPLPGKPTITSKKHSNPADTRVKILVPSSYLLTPKFITASIKANGGVVFPYTPIINYDHKADYAEQKIMHSNYASYFYQRSYITPITITGKFTVQNDSDAAVYLSTLHLLRALTKMQFGGAGGDFPDQMSGSPPPVCRLQAYGDYMLDNVPIAISNVRIELPDGVDYYTLGNLKDDTVFGQTTVPVLSTIAVTCHPMYSRAEMQKFSVNGWLNGKLRQQGYL